MPGSPHHRRRYRYGLPNSYDRKGGPNRPRPHSDGDQLSCGLPEADPPGRRARARTPSFGTPLRNGYAGTDPNHGPKQFKQ